MSIQDDIFDIADALKGDDVLPAWERFVAWVCRLEEECDKLREENNAFRKVVKFLKDEEDM